MDFEERLDRLRREAGDTGRIDAAGTRAIGAPLPASSQGYYGLPLLKQPVWTWEVPAYFFVGGVAGSSAVIAAIARAAGADPALARHARWIAAAGALASPALLISDLGRPERFLNMLRVFKVQSPMSVGAWTLVAFSTAASAAAFADAAERASGGRVQVRILGNAAEWLSAATGAVLATYTGVLIGATAIPAWSRHVHLLPIHFGASGLGAAVSFLELLGHRNRSLNALGIGAAAVETAIGSNVEAGAGTVDDPLTTGWSGTAVRLGTVLSGPVPLALRLFAGRSPHGRRLAALSMLAGSLLTRIGWIEAGRVSAAAPAGAETTTIRPS